TPAASGQWRKADILVAVAAADGRLPAGGDLGWTLEGRPYAPPRVEALGDGRYLLRDMDAAGGVLGVRLDPGDRFPADDAAQLRPPDRRTLRVALLDGTPPAIRAAVRADDSLIVGPASTAQVVVGDARAVQATGRPALVIADAAVGQPAFVFAGPDATGQ
uniref:hypothetical protein n=1 Tax=Escherichia coli TaxID=562 RepID=UPI0013039058